jgi:hypothetical protein
MPSLNGSALVIFRRVIFPFTAGIQGSPRALSVDVEGYVNMARQVVLDIYSAKYPGMDIELADIRLFYVDSAGDRIEIVSDEDICLEIREYTYNLSRQNLCITSPLIKKKGCKGQASATIGDAAKVFKVSPGPGALPTPGAQMETASATLPVADDGEILQKAALASLSQQQKPDVVADEALPITTVSAALAAAAILPEEAPKSVVEPPPTLAIDGGPPSTQPLVANPVVEQGVATKLLSLSPARRIYNRELLIQYVHCFPGYLLPLLLSSRTHQFLSFSDSRKLHPRIVLRHCPISPLPRCW